MKKNKDGRRLLHEVLEQYRFRAIELRAKGWRVKEIAESFGLNPDSVSRWFVKYRRKGKKSLKSTKALGPKPKLSPKQLTDVVNCLKKDALNFGFETPLWTCNELRLLILTRYKKKIHNSNVWRWLKRLKQSNQKPKNVAKEQDVREARRWLREEWPKILTHARRWKAIVYFQDEAGVSLIPYLGKTWGAKGKTPVVRLTGHKGGLSLSSAISMSGEMLFRFETEKVNAAIHIDFLSKLRTHHPNRKVIVILDNAPIHTAGAVGEYVNRHAESFAVYYLPSYSPELNPDELVWGYIKGNGLKAHSATNKVELKRVTKNAMHGIQKRPGLVKSFFKHAKLT